MLIQDNTNSFLVKYFSIMLKEKLNNNVKITSLYDNSIYNYFNIGDNLTITGYVAYPVIANNVLQYYNYAYVIGCQGTVVKNPYYYRDENEQIKYINLFPPFLNFDPSIELNQFIKLDFENSLIIQVDIVTGELLTDSEGKNYLTYNQFLTDDIVFLASFNDCRKSNDLCSYIYQYLKIQYEPLFDSSEGNKKIFDSSIANYFANTNSYLNPQKLKFDIDDFIASFLFERTISDISTPDQIQYVQNLLRYNRYLRLQYTADYLERFMKFPGVWGNLHELIYIYQNNLNIRYSLHKDNNQINNEFNIVIPTGFMDIVTEKYLLNEFEGDVIDGYYGESNSILRTN